MSTRNLLITAFGALCCVAVAYFNLGGNLSRGKAMASDKPAAKADKMPTPQELKQRLTPEQYSCTQEAGTEAPFKNAYWNNHADGIYVDVVSREPLFTSLDKYDSGTGWPSFSKPLANDLNLVSDHKFGIERTEVRSGRANSHLGHVFDDGPGPSKQRFCINSASLDFVPVDQLKAQGLGKYLFMFADKKGWDIATFAGGCFWGMEEFFENYKGVIESQVGYTGGDLDFATYENVTTGKTGHAEAIQILFDPAKVSYDELLLFFFRMHDPTTSNRQGNDTGSQYRSAIFYRSAKQHERADAIKLKVDKSKKWGKPVTTQITALGKFWRAEDYHQRYLDRHQGGYSCHFVRDFTFGE